MSWTCPGHYKVYVHGRDSSGRPIHGHCPVPLPALRSGRVGYQVTGHRSKFGALVRNSSLSWSQKFCQWITIYCKVNCE